MMNKLFTNWILNLIAIFSIALVSCSEEDGIKLGGGNEGFYIVNEGAFGGGNTSLSFYDRETATVSNNIFEAANGIPLGDQAQSMTIHNGVGFIIVQNSAKIEVIDLSDNTIIATIDDDIISPRYLVGLNSTKAYVSDWGADGVTGTVKAIDLSDYTVTKTITAGVSTNRLLINNSKLYAVNQGGFNSETFASEAGTTLVIIDTETDEVSQTVTLSDNPNSLQVDVDGNIWIASGGNAVYDSETFELIDEESSAGAIVKMSEDGTVLMTLTVDAKGWPAHPGNLLINSSRNQLYFTYNSEVYSMSTAATTLPTSAFISKSYYGLAIDPTDGSIIGCEAPNFTSAGNIDIYSPDGTLQTTYTVGIGPNGCTFK